MVFANNIQGQEGKVVLRTVGALIGYFAHWSLVADDGKQTYTFNATFGYANPKLWAYGEKEGYERRVTVRVGKAKDYLLIQPKDAKIEFNEKSLIMEKVTLCLPEDR